MMRSSEQQTAMNSLSSFLAQGENRDVSRVQSGELHVECLMLFESGSGAQFVNPIAVWFGEADK